jgi:hypothetical protein
MGSPSWAQPVPEVTVSIYVSNLGLVFTLDVPLLVAWSVCEIWWGIEIFTPVDFHSGQLIAQSLRYSFSSKAWTRIVTTKVP